ncbi:Caspase domain containing protein [Lactarius tabidus]
MDPVIEEGKPPGTIIGPSLGPTVRLKRRALLVGISYAHGPTDTWWELENPHQDVDMFRDLLVRTYGYSPEDITLLKDCPGFPDLLQPTRANMIHELTRLVTGAAPGDKFTFFYSGHSDRQKSSDDRSIEEDGQDEMIITSDIQRIVDNELDDILVRPLPAGTSLLASAAHPFAVFDTCHSGTLLDLPHHRCNSVYVPWQSKSQCVTATMRNNNVVRHQAMGLSDLRGTTDPFPSISGVIARDNAPFLADPWPPHPRLLTTTKSEESTEDGQPNRGMGSEAGPTRKCRPRSNGSFLSPTRHESPVSNVCDGWCRYNSFTRRTALSLSACSDPQRACEGPRGSLTTVLCRYLEKHPHPSYRNLMSHVNFALHDLARELHTYTRQQKKEGSDFDGELDNFQEAKLSSLWKLNMDELFQL